jgi:hypothetical protein
LPSESIWIPVPIWSWPPAAEVCLIPTSVCALILSTWWSHLFLIKHYDLYHHSNIRTILSVLIFMNLWICSKSSVSCKAQMN